MSPSPSSPSTTSTEEEGGGYWARRRGDDALLEGRRKRCGNNLESPIPILILIPPVDIDVDHYHNDDNLYVMSRRDRSRYDLVFPRHSDQYGYLYEPEAVSLFS